jgi:ABC-type bacteriocin/lantibiotic exporter with double-glycine peptidase domain
MMSPQPKPVPAAMPRDDRHDDADLPSPAGALDWLRRFAGSHPRLVGEATLALLIAQLLALVPALAFSIVIDKVIGNQAAATLVVIAGALMGAALAEWAFSALRRRLQGDLRRRAAERDDGALFDAVLRLPAADGPGSATATAERLERIVTVREAAIDAIEAILVAPVMLIAILAAMAFLDIRMAAMVACAALVHGALVAAMRGRLRVAGRTARLATERGRAATADIAGGAGVIRGLGAEDAARATWLDATRAARAGAQTLEDLRGKLAGISAFKNRLLFVALLALGAYEVDAGVLTVGGFVAISMLLRHFASIFEAAMPLWQRSAELRGWVERIDMASARATSGRATLAIGLAPRGALSLRRVGFGYAREPDLLTGLDIEIGAGECVAIVGPTGCGKSTLLGLMAGSLAPRRGVVALDGHDLARLAPQELRRCVRLAGQDPCLFAGTVLDNLRLGAPEAGFPEVERAARLARAHDMILRLPFQYATALDERRYILSPGERQRLCLARALLACPPVLLLDDPGIAFGAGEEAEFLAALAEIRVGRTVVIATASPAILSRADRIVAIRAGRVATASRAA